MSKTGKTYWQYKRTYRNDVETIYSKDSPYWKLVAKGITAIDWIQGPYVEKEIS